MDSIDQQNELDKIIAEAWDANVELRSNELCHSTDFSYHNIILPWVIKNATEIEYCDASILDVGCGCGYLTNVLFSNVSKNITGIDISKNSIRIAKKLYPHIEFYEENIFSYISKRKIQLCLSIMTANNLSNIDLFFNKINTLLSNDGKMILVLPHPCFWPIKHLANHSFAYLEEKTYSYKFSTKSEKRYPSAVPYFHRPLERYINCIFDNGLTIEKITELPEKECVENPDIIDIIIKKV